jgi:hypothetical protein
MKSRQELHDELRKKILALPQVREQQDAGIHEDAFFIQRTMFMHIHGHGYCDIRLPKEAQQQILAQGKAQPHRWASEAGYVTFILKHEEDLKIAMELVQISYNHFVDHKNFFNINRSTI